MRHKYFGRKLNRDVKERKALFRALVVSFIKYGKIKTTYAKAKAIHGLIEKLVTKAKKNTQPAISGLSSFLIQKEAIEKMVKVIAPRFKEKIGGYVRIRKLGKRMSDSTEEVMIEWTIPEEVKKPQEKKEKKPILKIQKKENPAETNKK